MRPRRWRRPVGEDIEGILRDARVLDEAEESDAEPTAAAARRSARCLGKMTPSGVRSNA